MTYVDVRLRSPGFVFEENTMRCYWGRGGDGENGARIPVERARVVVLPENVVGRVVGYSVRQLAQLEVLAEPCEIRGLDLPAGARYADVLDWWRASWTRPMRAGYGGIREASAGDLKNVPKNEALDQLAALLAFAKRPRSWRQDLKHCWMLGCYSEYRWAEFDGALQRIRNHGHMRDVELILKHNKELFNRLKETYRG